MEKAVREIRGKATGVETDRRGIRILDFADDLITGDDTEKAANVLEKSATDE